MPAATAMSETLSISLVQTSTLWHDPGANRARFEALFAALPTAGDLVILPEMFSTGFTMDSRAQAETMDGPTAQWLLAMAERYQRVFCGSIIIRDGEHFYNRLLWAAPDRALHTYDKRHRFRMAGEHEHYDAGARRLIVSINGWRICPLICYDLRFPLWSRNAPIMAAEAGNESVFDLLLYVANWPAPRHAAWQTLLPARAIENLAYVAAVNVIGVDGNDLSYAGGSGVWHPDGQPLAQLGAREAVVTTRLERTHLHAWRNGFPAWQDRDAFTLNSDNQRGG